MKPKYKYKFLLVSLVTLFFGAHLANAQFLLQAPNSSDEHNYKWYEASDTNAVLGTDFFYVVTNPGINFATYDGTLCGSNATGYFIVTDCTSPDNEVTLDISNNVSPSAVINWSPAIGGNRLRPTVVATNSVVRYTATVTKAGNNFDLPSFTVVCLQQSSVLNNDLITVNEDETVVVPIFNNDSGLPTTGILTTSKPFNGSVLVNNSGTPNNPSDDIVTFVPNPNFNGSSMFTYTICDALGACSSATVDINILPIVDAFDDSVATVENTPVDVNIMLNDNDIPTLGTLTTTNPSKGNVVVDNNGTPNNLKDDFITYTPNNNFAGSDFFSYTICDVQSKCSTATVNILVNLAGIVNIDSDNDGILDNFEDLNLDGDNNSITDATDSDNDGVPDYLDIDSDDDGIPDNVEAQSTEEYIPPSSVDANNNGLDDAYEINGNLGLFPIDTDGDSLPDYLDEDSDNDQVPDSIEGHDYNKDGIPDAVYMGSDKDNDGLDDGYEAVTKIDVDINNGINNPYYNLPNTDGDEEVDYRDTDDDDDGIRTVNEDENGDGDYANDDFDEDGIPNYLDADLVVLEEDAVEVFNVLTPNGDGIHDYLKINRIENYPNNTIKIFNRWGVLVFATKAYNNETNYFDGTSEGRVTIKADNKLPVGTYFYILEFTPSSEGKMTKLTGYIYINK